MDESKKIESVGQGPESDQKSLHNAVERASKDAIYISQVVQQLDAMEFSAYNIKILNFIKSNSTDGNSNVEIFKPYSLVSK
jgi:flavin-binding protein dodecin